MEGDEPVTDYCFKLMCEVHGNISAANFYFDVTSSFNRYINEIEPTPEMTITIEENQLSIDIHDAQLINRGRQFKLTLLTIDELFIPTSFHNQKGMLIKLRKQGNKVVALYSLECTPVFRVQINTPKLIKENSAENAILSNSSHDQLEIDLPYSISCSFCHNSLTDDTVTFNKICDLPFDLTELFENLFCHKYCDRDTLNVVSQPANELFLTSTCYVLSCINKKYLCEDDELSILKCKQCSSVICCNKRKNSNRFKDSLFCFKDKITFTSSQQSACNNTTKTINIALDTLLCIIRDTLETSVVCKLYLEAKESLPKHECLLIWVIDRNMKRFLIQETETHANVEKHIEFESVVKVLYCACASNSSLASAWVCDFSVDSHHVSDTMLKEIIKYLSESSTNMPYVEGYPSEFSVGYLPLKL